MPPITGPVLVVDDDAAVRQSLKFALEREGLEVPVYEDSADKVLCRVMFMNSPVCPNGWRSTIMASARCRPWRANRSMPMDNSVTENLAAHRFEMAVGDSIAAAYYRLEDGKVVLTHTEVPQELSGQGIGSRLADGVFRLIRASRRKAVVRCSFMAGWVNRHPEVADLVG
jgi:uncharacterized protein